MRGRLIALSLVALVLAGVLWGALALPAKAFYTTNYVYELTVSDPTVSLSGSATGLQADFLTTATCTYVGPGMAVGCEWCVQVTYYGWNGSAWTQVGSTQTMSEVNGKTGTSCNANNPVRLSFEDVLEGSFAVGNEYKAVVTMYPVPCDQLEVYADSPTWTGGTTAWVN